MSSLQRVSLVIFRAAEYTCAIRSSQVAELLLMPEVVGVTGQPGLLDGFFNLRGSIVPVVALHRLFQKAAPDPGLYTPLIVLANRARPLALRVDAVEELAAVEQGDILPCSPQDSLNDCAEGQFEHGERQVVLLAPERLLLAKESMCLADLAARVRERLDVIGEPAG